MSESRRLTYSASIYVDGILWRMTEAECNPHSAHVAAVGVLSRHLGHESLPGCGHHITIEVEVDIPPDLPEGEAEEFLRAFGLGNYN